MSARSDLAAIYVSDPEARWITHGTGPARRRTRGFLTMGTTFQGDASGLQVAAAGTQLRVIAGSLGTPPTDTILTVGEGAAARRYRLLARLTVIGDGSEQLAFVAAEDA